MSDFKGAKDLFIFAHCFSREKGRGPQRHGCTPWPASWASLPNYPFSYELINGFIH